MTTAGYIALLLWPCVSLGVFALGGPRLGLVWSFVAGWLLLPEGVLTFAGLPNYSKNEAIVVAAVLGILLAPAESWRFRWRWCYLPVIILPAAGFIASLVNGLGAYDGISTALSLATIWSIPFLLGSMFVSDERGLRYIAFGIVIGGLLYIPLCLYEMRMSPQLHHMLYGFYPNSLGMGNTMRFGGWRPMVFTPSGLALGLWMASASFVAWWLWTTGAVRRLAGVPMGWIVLALFTSAVFCRSFGALVLLVGGLAVCWFSRRLQSRLLVVLLLAVTPTYIAARTVGLWHGEGVVEASAMIDEDRAGSFQFRLENEDMLVDKALEKPLFGWGGWGRSRVYDDDTGRDLTITDGRWIIQLGQSGLAGMISLFVLLLLPLGWLVVRHPPSRLTSAEFAPAFALAVAGVLYAIDRLPNAMENPVFVLACGGVTGFLASRQDVDLLEEKRPPGVETAGRVAPFAPARRLHPGGP